jgi:hypothetical protein
MSFAISLDGALPATFCSPTGRYTDDMQFMSSEPNTGETWMLAFVNVQENQAARCGDGRL